jgi:GH15 family glucan-1,4-alpha-glucosidase
MATTPTDLPVEELRALARASVALILELQAPSGAYPASPTFPVYRFSWFRDGAFIADAMSRAGRPESADRFFGWCAGVVTARRARIESLLEDAAAGRPVAAERFLPCRFTLDGRDDDGDWWNFQLDGYGAWLWALAAHARRTGGGLGAYADAVELTVEYLHAFWNEPCYDWWEEHADHRHTSTLASIAGGLATIADADGVAPPVAATARATAAAARRALLASAANDGGILTKWQGSDAVDGSLLACATPFGVLPPDDPVMQRTLARVEERLVRGGVYRYEADTYYGGGEWVLLAGILGWHYAELGRTEDAWAKLRWMAHQARGGELPEQTSTHLLAPEHEQEWIGRWGPSACPLLWSHAMYVTLAVELGVAVAEGGT